MYLKSLYLRNLLMFIEEQLGLKEGNESLFSFVSHMESRLLLFARERIRKISLMQKLLFFVPLVGWIKLILLNKEFVIDQYNRSIVSTLQIKRELEKYGIDSRDIVLDIANHNTDSYKIYNWVNWD